MAHLLANLAGAALVGALGWVAGVPARFTWAWAAAWPLTQLGLLAEPSLLHYGGLSGVLHAGVAVAALHLVLAGPGTQRRIALAILCGLVIKVLSESPWEGAHFDAALGISVAPLAHATGLAAGIACSLGAWAVGSWANQLVRG